MTSDSKTAMMFHLVLAKLDEKDNQIILNFISLLESQIETKETALQEAKILLDNFKEPMSQLSSDSATFMRQLREILYS